MLIWFCITCDQRPFLSTVPVCPECLSSNCAAMLDGETGQPMGTNSEREREVASQTGFATEEMSR